MKERQRWQPEEDALLRAYVKQYGPKEWNLISQRMGKPLDRDPKSCLERWKNYLKPGIKKGSLTPEEQNLVISLQAKYGNKWKKIAAEVPGRTAKRLGKWWEVFKEKQLKQLQKSQKNHLDYGTPPGVSAVASVGDDQYDHAGGQPFASGTAAGAFTRFDYRTREFRLYTRSPAPALDEHEHEHYPHHDVVLNLLLLHSIPSVSLTLSPSEPAVLDPTHPEITGIPPRFFPVQQVGLLLQHCKELEEGRENWMRHKKEATWRLNRLEQQLESEKARRRREKTDEIEAKIRCLREEETAFMSRIEGEYREQVKALEREAEAKEAKLMEGWCRNQVKLGKLLAQIGHGFSAPPPN
ncbi:UNVERIFIED_CONTAM: Transcription factor AS1 [Sesamum calycinum]|uniref:Transcription factor AS1 n=1 Tax=Sesamum calycinum TaxID=2727403 RepID=A0AAW2SU56_9LAMI